MVKIAVLMSLYNETEEQILQSVESILAQTFGDFEFIIVNDAPGDEMMAKVSRRLEKMDKRIKVLYNEKNIGLAMSMNKAAEASESEYIARMDADDIAKTDRFEKEVAALEEGHDFVCSNYVFIEYDGTLSREQSVYYPAATIERALPYGNIIHHPTIMMKRQIFEDVGGYRDFPCSQDYDLWLRLLEKGIKIKSLKEKLIYYRLRENGVSRSNPMKQIATLDYIRKLYRERKTRDGLDSYSLENYSEYLKSVGVGDEDKEKKYTKYKKIQESAIINYRKGRKIKGAFGYARAFFGNKFIRSKFMNGLKFRRALKGVK